MSYASYQKPAKILLSAIVLTCPTLSLANNETILSFNEIYEAALNNSLDKLKIEHAIKTANFELEALALKDALKLTSNGSLGAKYNLLQASGANDKKASASPGSFDEALSLQATATLYDFGKANAEKHKYELLVKEKENGLFEVAFTLKWKVARTYAKVLAAEASLKQAEEQLAQAEEKLKLITSNFAHGLRSEYDVSRAEADLGRAKLAKIKSKDDLVIFKSQLLLFIDKDITSNNKETTNYKFSGEVIRPIKDWQSIIATWTKIETSPSERTRLAQMNTNKAELEAIEAKKYPLISASTNIGITNSNPLDAKFPEYSFKTALGAQLGFSWDIPWNGAFRSDIERVQLKEKDFSLQGDLDYRQRSEKIIIAQKQIDIYFSELSLVAEQIKLVKNNFDLVKKKYDAGKASALELTTSEDELISIKNELLKTNTSIASSVIDLAEAKGIVAIDSIFTKDSQK